VTYESPTTRAVRAPHAEGFPSRNGHGRPGKRKSRCRVGLSEIRPRLRSGGRAPAPRPFDHQAFATEDRRSASDRCKGLDQLDELAGVSSASGPLNTSCPIREGVLPIKRSQPSHNLCPALRSNSSAFDARLIRLRNRRRSPYRLGARSYKRPEDGFIFPRKIVRMIRGRPFRSERATEVSDYSVLCSLGPARER